MLPKKKSSSHTEPTLLSFLFSVKPDEKAKIDEILLSEESTTENKKLALKNYTSLKILDYIKKGGHKRILSYISDNIKNDAIFFRELADFFQDSKLLKYASPTLQGNDSLKKYMSDLGKSICEKIDQLSKPTSEQILIYLHNDGNIKILDKLSSEVKNDAKFFCSLGSLLYDSEVLRFASKELQENDDLKKYMTKLKILIHKQIDLELEATDVKEKLKKYPENQIRLYFQEGGNKKIQEHLPLFFPVSYDTPISFEQLEKLFKKI